MPAAVSEPGQTSDGRQPYGAIVGPCETADPAEGQAGIVAIVRGAAACIEQRRAALVIADPQSAVGHGRQRRHGDARSVSFVCGDTLELDAVEAEQPRGRADPQESVGGLREHPRLAVQAVARGPGRVMPLRERLRRSLRDRRVRHQRRRETRGDQAQDAPQDVRAPPVRRQQATLDSERDGVGAIVRTELLHEVADVEVDRGLGDAKLVGDLLVAMAVTDEAEDVELTPREVLVGVMRGEARRHVRRNRAPAAVHGPDGVEQVAGRGGFQDVADGAGAQRPFDLGIPFDGREHDDSRVGEFPEDGRQRVDAVRPREPDVHQRHVGAALAERNHRVMRRGRHGHEAHVGLGADDRGEALAEDGVVFHAQDRDRVRRCAGRAHSEKRRNVTRDYGMGGHGACLCGASAQILEAAALYRSSGPNQVVSASASPTWVRESAERERERLHASVEELDLELSIADRSRLSEQLIQALFDGRAVAAGVHVAAVSGTR